MSIEDILQALDEQCREECQSIFGEAQKEVDDILAKVEVEVEDIRLVKLEKFRAEAANEKSGMYYSARLKAKNLVIEAKESVLSEALRQAQEDIGTLRGKPDYPEVFGGLLSEALARIGEEGVMHVDPRDEQLARRVLGDKGLDLQIITDLECSGGVMVSDKEDRVHIVNTFDERIKRARERMKLEIADILFGEMDKASLSSVQT
jgi:vacuolar-type H+-ATPase subunit E/Vma4